MDLVDETQVIGLMESALDVSGRIDILVNNAGMAGPMTAVEKISSEEWDETMSVNVKGVFLCCKHLVPVMKKQKAGCIVNIASVTGKRALPERTPYAASKMAVIGLIRTLAAELGSWNIRVNSICPGIVCGPRLDKVFEGIARHSGKSRDEVAAERLTMIALKCFVDPSDVADYKQIQSNIQRDVIIQPSKLIGTRNKIHNSTKRYLAIKWNIG